MRFTRAARWQHVRIEVFRDVDGATPNGPDDRVDRFPVQGRQTVERRALQTLESLDDARIVHRRGVIVRPRLAVAHRTSHEAVPRSAA